MPNFPAIKLFEFLLPVLDIISFKFKREAQGFHRSSNKVVFGLLTVSPEKSCCGEKQSGDFREPQPLCYGIWRHKRNLQGTKPFSSSSAAVERFSCSKHN